MAGGLDSVLGGSDELAEGEGDVDVVDAGFCELGIAGNGGTAVCLLAVPLAITRAMTSAVTSTTAAAAAIHNQRGALGRPGGGSTVG
ncbi:MAG: hypothetical protein WBE66_11490 [Mycobacterium sp.]